MTGPKGNSEFCFLETLIELEGKQNSVSAEPVIKCFVIPPTQNRKKKCEAIFCLTLAGSHICRGFKEHDLITCESKVQVLEINRVYDFKYLSIVLDHVGYVISRLGKRVGVLGRIRKNTMHAALEMYKSLILLILEYCDVVWASCNDADIERLESLQRRASKIIVKSKCSTISIDYLKFQS